MIAARVAAAIAALISIVASHPTVALAGPNECAARDQFGYCVEWEVSTPGGSGEPAGSGGDQPVCYWVNLDDDIGAEDPTVFSDFGLPYPPDGVEIVWQEWVCSDGSPAFNFRWVVPATPGNLATIARGRLVGELPQPVVGSSPPLGTASIVGVPVFVEVVNWTGVVSESECAGGLCVTVTATPVLRFAPGETGSSPLACAGAGSRYVSGGDPVEVQAVNACAYAYVLRTGVSGRPSVWPGVVSVTWSLSWAATSGASGSLPSVTRSTDAPRAVSEVQTVVVGGVTP